MSLSLLAALVGGRVSAQEIQDLVRAGTTDKSASPAVTRSIAEYIATRNNAAVVQVMARSRPNNAPSMTVEALLAAIESNARMVGPTPARAALVAPAPAAPPAPAKKKVVKKGGGSGGGGGGHGGGSGGGGGGW
jgi:hypothetical protein